MGWRVEGPRRQLKRALEKGVQLVSYAPQFAMKFFCLLEGKPWYSSNVKGTVPFHLKTKKKGLETQKIFYFLYAAMHKTLLLTNPFNY